MKKLVCLFLRGSLALGIITLVAIIGFSIMACDDELSATEVDPDANKGWLTFSDGSLPSEAYIIENYWASDILDKNFVPAKAYISVKAYHGWEKDASAKRIRFQVPQYDPVYVFGSPTGVGGVQSRRDPAWTNTGIYTVFIRNFSPQREYIKSNVFFTHGNATVAFSDFTHLFQD